MLNLNKNRLSIGVFALLVPLSLPVSSPAQDMAKPTTEMQAVLDKLAAPDAKPFSTLTVPEARTQASPADAARAILWDKRLSSNPDARITGTEKPLGKADREWFVKNTGTSMDDARDHRINLKDGGVAVKTFNGVTPEFFGMGKVVPEAKQAPDLAVADLAAAFTT